MNPILSEGDEITVEKIKFEDIRKGDILLFRIGDTFFAHRFVKYIKRRDDRKGKIIQCGDNSMEFKPVDEDAVVGRVKSVKRIDSVDCLTQGSWKILNRLTGIIQNALYTVTCKAEKEENKKILQIYGKITHIFAKTTIGFFSRLRGFFSKK